MYQRADGSVSFNEREQQVIDVFLLMQQQARLRQRLARNAEQIAAILRPDPSDPVALRVA